MPLLDHFHPPVSKQIQWNSLHSAWASRIADQLCERLPPDFRAEEHIKLPGGVEIDIATYRDGQKDVTRELTDQERASWIPPKFSSRVEVDFPGQFEIRIVRDGIRELVAAIELISPSNKDRPIEREAFAAKVCNYLQSGICVLIVDVVTTRRANLHNEIVRLLDLPADHLLPDDTPLYAVTYRPAVHQQKTVLDLWRSPIMIGDPLPEMPLRLTGELFVPVDLEAAYWETCRRRRLFE